MALTPYQRSICRLLADNRVASGESYVAGGVALNELLAGARISRDIDLFHDTAEAVASSVKADGALLVKAGHSLEMLREMPGFAQARITKGEESALIDWARDSSYRFFPLLEHEELGLTLHPFDLATNKVLALVGRLEVRDWIDVLHCDRRLQPFGFLTWAACGKDPGFSPSSLLEHAARTSRYTQDEVDTLEFDEGAPPDASLLAASWHQMLAAAKDLHQVLPAEHSGKVVLDENGTLCQRTAQQLDNDNGAEKLLFRAGAIRGSLPRISSG